MFSDHALRIPEEFDVFCETVTSPMATAIAIMAIMISFAGGWVMFSRGEVPSFVEVWSGLAGKPFVAGSTPTRPLAHSATIMVQPALADKDMRRGKLVGAADKAPMVAPRRAPLNVDIDQTIEDLDSRLQRMQRARALMLYGRFEDAREILMRDTTGIGLVDAADRSIAPRTTTTAGSKSCPPMLSVNFGFNDTKPKAVLPQADIARLTKWLRDHPSAIVTIEGHADSWGGVHRNLAVSQLRALAVAEMLTAAGVPEYRLRRTGFGETKPVVGMPGWSGANRRVHVFVDDAAVCEEPSAEGGS